VEPDDEHDDEGSSGPLLPPADRLWRHPSELSFASATPAGGRATLAMAAAASGDMRLWVVALVAASIGALLATGVAYTTGGARTRTVSVPAVERDMLTPAVTLASAAATSEFLVGASKVRGACVTLYARDAHGTRVSSGVVFRSDGMLLTTAHTVHGAQSLTVTVSGAKRTARIIAVDQATDLAVVKIEGNSYEPAPLGSALGLRVGDTVLAMRPSSGGSGSGSDTPGDKGWIGALGKEITASTGELSDLLQIDMTQAPQTVGGPVVDNHGAVVAIMSAFGDSGKSRDFATPIDIAREVASQLLATGRVVPVWLGVEGADLASDIAKTLGVEGGAVVHKVYTGSPAATAGIKDGDVILAIDGQVVTSMPNLVTALHAHPPGTEVRLDVHRDGDPKTVTARLEAPPTGDH